MDPGQRVDVWEESSLHWVLLSRRAAFLRANAGESPSARPEPGSLRPSPPGAAAVAQLHAAVSFICFDKIINLQSRTLKAWDQLKTNTGGIMRN